MTSIYGILNQLITTTSVQLVWSTEKFTKTVNRSGLLEDYQCTASAAKDTPVRKIYMGVYIFLYYLLYHCRFTFSGQNVEPFCRKLKPSHCENVLFRAKKIRANCIPVYDHDKSPRDSCNSDYRCRKWSFIHIIVPASSFLKLAYYRSKIRVV